MIDIFDNLYSLIFDKNRFLSKIKYYSMLRFIIRRTSNLVLPIFFIITKKKTKYKLNQEQRNLQIIVSLTSFPLRINKIWLVIETIFRQSYKPDKIILWLSKEQFRGQINDIPPSLINLISRGLEIRFVEGDIKSHKKYFYVMQEFPESTIITIDDDVFYHSKVLENLINLSNQYPKSIICNHAHYIKKVNNELVQYSKWENVRTVTEPNDEILAVGVGGVLYPSRSLYRDFNNLGLIARLCPLADDIWLHSMEKLQNTKIVKTPFNSRYLPIINSKNVTLTSKNVTEEYNDVQINKLRKYYLEVLNKDIF